MVGTYNEWATKIAGTTFKITAKAGESGRLFGSVAAHHLIAAIKEQVGLSIEKRVLEMPEEVKELGAYTAIIKFHPEVITNAKFEVVAEEA